MHYIIAGFYGGMKDAISAAAETTRLLVSEIAKFPNFEHLECQGSSQARTVKQEGYQPLNEQISDSAYRDSTSKPCMISGFHA